MKTLNRSEMIDSWQLLNKAACHLKMLGFFSSGILVSLKKNQATSSAFSEWVEQN